MKTIKTMSIIAIVLCGLGLLGGLMLIGDEPATGFLALLIYGYFLWYSIAVLQHCDKCCVKPEDKEIK